MKPDLPAEAGAFHPPDGFLAIAERLEAGGFEAWGVGGAIRDAHMGVDRADWDIATDARPAQVRGLFPRTVPLGIEHGTVGVIAGDGTMYEVTTFRRDVETDGRHAVVEFAESIDEDLSRRDFTINAVAWRPATGELRDPFRGLADLDRGVLRAVGDPEQRFAEDYLRVLRGLRFAGRYISRSTHARENPCRKRSRGSAVFPPNASARNCSSRLPARTPRTCSSSTRPRERSKPGCQNWPRPPGTIHAGGLRSVLSMPFRNIGPCSAWPDSFSSFPGTNRRSRTR